MSSMEAQSSAQAPSKKSHFRGVRKRPSNRFAAEIRDPSKKRRVWLGTYNSDIEAAHAYDLAARAIKGCKAKTNFPLFSFQNPNLIHRRATDHNNPQPHEEKVAVPSLINSNMLGKAASRPWTHDFISKSLNVGMGSSSSPSLLQVMFPPELQRQQQLAALKISNQPRHDESEGGSEESDSPSNRSHPSSSAVTECRDSPTMGGLDLNFPALDIEGDEYRYPRKTLWLLK